MGDKQCKQRGAFHCRVVVVFVCVGWLTWRERWRRPKEFPQSCNWVTAFLLMIPWLRMLSPLYDRGLISLYLRSSHCAGRLVEPTDCWGLLAREGLKGSFLTTVLAVSAENCYGSKNLCEIGGSSEQPPHPSHLLFFFFFGNRSTQSWVTQSCSCCTHVVLNTSSCMFFSYMGADTAVNKGVHLAQSIWKPGTHWNQHGPCAKANIFFLVFLFGFHQEGSRVLMKLKQNSGAWLLWQKTDMATTQVIKVMKQNN